MTAADRSRRQSTTDHTTRIQAVTREAADELWKRIGEMNEALRKANNVHARLVHLANSAERAAESVDAHKEGDNDA